MQLSLIKPRIATIPDFVGVAGAAELAVAMQRAQFTQQAYVVLTKRAPGENTSGTLAVSQKLTEHFGIAFWARDLSDANGSAAFDACQAISQKLLDAFLAWSPQVGVYSPCQYVGGRLLTFAPTAGVLWLDEFRTHSIIRKAAQ